MFLQSAAEALLQRDKLRRRDVENLWHQLVCPNETVTVKQAMKLIRRAPVDKAAPLMSLVQTLMETAMKEV